MKHPVDTSQWGDFVVGELFDCDTTKTFYPNKSELPPGNTPYITRSTYDNGISGYYDDINNEFTIEGNCLTIGAEGGIAFWQPKPFIAGVKVYTIRHPQLNELTALFVASLLNANSANYNYTNARVLAKIKAESIPLPLKSSADPSNYSQEDIDWDYMETVMSRVTTRAKERLANLPQPADKKKTPVDTSQWGEFAVGELFDVAPCAKLTKKELVPGDTLLVTNAKTQTRRVGNDAPTFEDVIVVTCFGDAFYFASKIIPSCVIVLKQRHNNGKAFALFVTAILNATLKGYVFSNRATKKKVLDTKIKLPVDKNGEIDYNKIKSAMGDILDIAENRLNDLKEIFLNGKLQ